MTATLRRRLGDDAFTSRYTRGKDLDTEAARKRLDPAEALSALVPG